MSYTRRTLQVVAFLATLVVGTASMAVIVTQTTWFKEWLRGFIVKQAEDYVNGRLSIGRLDGNLFFGVDLGDVDVTVNGERVVDIDDIALDYNAFIDDAFEIDSRGFVVGAEGNQGTDAKLWDLAGDRRSLGTLDIGTHFSGARAINDRRQVVGFHSSAAGPVAFLWEQDSMIDLNLLLPPGTPWELTGAHDINDAGQILGTGRMAGESSSTRFVMTLSSEAEEVTQLCRGWCEPIRRCGLETGPFNNVIWSRDDHPRYNGCVNGCVAYAMDPQRPHTLEQERAVRDCFLAGGQALCAQQWEPRTEACCVNLGLGSCDVYY